MIVFDVEGFVRDLKRVVGFEEDARCYCCVVGDCVDVFNELRMYLDGDFMYVVVIDV